MEFKANSLPVHLHETDRGRARLCWCQGLCPSAVLQRLPPGHRCAQSNLLAGCPWQPAGVISSLFLQVNHRQHERKKKQNSTVLIASVSDHMSLFC